VSRLRAYRDSDLKTPALGIAIRWTLVGIQIGRRCYIVRWDR
jgi:hypothetical protein